MTINWNVSIKANVTNPANWLVAAVYDHSAPLVPVQYIPLPKPYGDTKNIVFTNLDTIVYDFKLFESPNQTPQGVVLNTFSFQPSLGTITVIRDDLYLTAGVTTGFATGGTQYDDNSLIGWIYNIERVGFGLMQKGIDYELTLNGVPENSTKANGWRLLAVGDQFGDQEKFFLHFQPQVTSTSTGGSGGGSNLITGTVILDSDIILDNTYMKKVCFLQGLSDHFTVTLPALNTVGDNQMITFISEGGNHINATIDGNGGDIIKYLGGNQADMIMGQSEQFSLLKANGVWNVLFPDGNFKIVGEIVHKYSNQQINTVFANGLMLSRTAHARLWRHVSTTPGILISESQWNVTQNVNGRTVFVNRGKFTTGDGSTTFRAPMLPAVGNLKNIDGSSRSAGSFEADSVGPAQVKTAAFTGQGLGKNSLNSNNGVGFLATYGDGGFITTDSASGVNNTNARTDPWSLISSNETKEANFGVYALIRI